MTSENSWNSLQDDLEHYTQNNGEQPMPKRRDPVAGFEKSARRRQLQKAKRSMKRNRDARSPRRRDWLDLAHTDEDTTSHNHATERIMPRDERERRKGIEELMSTGEREQVLSESEAAAGVQGRVVEVSSGLCRVECPGGVALCSLRGSLSASETGYTTVVAVGDCVVISQDGRHQGVVEKVLPRRNQITRPDPFYRHLQQTLVANVDQLLVVASWRDPHIWPELIDRYLIAAERDTVTPLLCVNKIDLADSLEEVRTAIGPYQELGYRVILTSAERGDGVAALRLLLEGQVTVLAGLSGVGKSTLLSAVDPSFDLRVGAVNEERHQGRHTTSQSIMLPLGANGYVVDTPGIREFGLAGLHRGELIAFYPDLEEAARACRFSDCTHDHEPDCAVRAAAEDGTISATRFDSFRKIWATLPD
jgi:ribosome biogenesis GTPase